MLAASCTYTDAKENLKEKSYPLRSVYAFWCNFVMYLCYLIVKSIVGISTLPFMEHCLTTGAGKAYRLSETEN